MPNGRSRHPAGISGWLLPGHSVEVLGPRNETLWEDYTIFDKVRVIVAVSLLLSLPAVAQDQPPLLISKTGPSWVERSNAYAQVLIRAEASFRPEAFSEFGIPDYDDQTVDLGADNAKRFRAAVARAKSELHDELQIEHDPNVRVDLDIMITAAADEIESSELRERLELPWTDAPKLVFEGIHGLLSKQVAADRRGHALNRLKRYAGMVNDTTPVMTLARQRYEERVGDAALLRPSKREVEQAVQNAGIYVTGIRKLFADFNVAGGEDALNALEGQANDYVAWLRATVLPQARTETKLPPALYANALKRVGIDIDAQSLVQRAQLEFMETRAEMQELAPLVAREKGIPATDYRDVIRALKRDTIPNDDLESQYQKVIEKIELIIREQKIVAEPNRPMEMRLGTPAEGAAQPAPHFLPAPLVGDTGRRGTSALLSLR